MNHRIAKHQRQSHEPQAGDSLKKQQVGDGMPGYCFMLKVGVLSGRTILRLLLRDFVGVIECPGFRGFRSCDVFWIVVPRDSIE